MLNEHTLDQLRSLRLDGMVRAIEEQATSTAAATLSFDERLTLLVQREVAWRDDRRVQRLLKAAKLKVSSACIEDINWRASRSLDRGLVATLALGLPAPAYAKGPLPDPAVKDFQRLVATTLERNPAVAPRGRPSQRK